MDPYSEDQEMESYQQDYRGFTRLEDPPFRIELEIEASSEESDFGQTDTSQSSGEIGSSSTSGGDLVDEQENQPPRAGGFADLQQKPKQKHLNPIQINRRRRRLCNFAGSVTRLKKSIFQSIKKKFGKKHPLSTAICQYLTPNPKLVKSMKARKFMLFCFLVKQFLRKSKLVDLFSEKPQECYVCSSSSSCQMFCAVFSQLINSIFDDERTVEVWNLVNEGKKNRDDRFQDFEDSIEGLKLQAEESFSKLEYWIECQAKQSMQAKKVK